MSYGDAPGFSKAVVGDDGLDDVVRLDMKASDYVFQC